MIQTLKWCPRGDLTQSLNSSISHIILSPTNFPPTLLNVDVYLQPALFILLSYSNDFTTTVNHRYDELLSSILYTF